MKAMALGLREQHIIPISPISKTFTVQSDGKKLKIMRYQLLMTPAFVFTDFHGQGQTINPVLIDIGPPPSGGLTTYVVLLQCKNIRLLQEFDDKIFTEHPSEFLMNQLEGYDTENCHRGQTPLWFPIWNTLAGKCKKAV
jgi:hypothetical protein